MKDRNCTVCGCAIDPEGENYGGYINDDVRRITYFFCDDCWSLAYGDCDYMPPTDPRAVAFVTEARALHFEHCNRAGIIPTDAADDARMLRLVVEAESCRAGDALAWFRQEDREEINARALAKLAIGEHPDLRFRGGAYRACVRDALKTNI
jgi:hypothetical protein